MLNFTKEEPKITIKAYLSREYDTRLPSNVQLHRVSSDVTCIAEGIDDDLNSFNATLIQAPTGFGKTHFIIHEVLPKVIQTGGKMLLVSNRVAVSYQQKQEVMEMVDPSEVGCLTPKGVLKKTDFGPVKIMTLQALDLFLATSEGEKYAKEVTVLVVDEVHYFIGDIAFNPNAARLIRVIAQLFNEATRIYMTATPEDVLTPLAEVENKVIRPLKERMGVRFSPLMLGQPPVIDLYQYKSDKYRSLPIRYFLRNDDLYRKIEESGEDKWLIFVPSKEQGATLQETIGDDAMFISADSKGSDMWNQLLSEERLPCRVLITTSVLDCGVNIHDEALKHVVIPFEDQVTFIQALGRVRFKDTPNFTLYAKAIDKKRLNGLMYRNRELLSLAAEIKKIGHYNSYVDRFRQEGDRSKEALLYLEYNNEYTFNELYHHKLRRQRQYYGQLAADIDQYGRSAFPRLVHQWLGQPDAYDDRNWLGYNNTEKAKQDLFGFLKLYDGRVLKDKEEQRKFSETIHKYYQAISGKKKRADRGNQYLKTSALNNCLAELSIDGRVISEERGKWSFTIKQ